MVAAAAVAYVSVLRGAFGRLERDPVPAPASGLGRTRRELLRAAVGAAGLLATGFAVRRLTGGIGDAGGQPLARPAGAAPVRPAPDPAGRRRPGRLGDRWPHPRGHQQPAPLHRRRVDHRPQRRPAGSWRLRVEGLVGRPLTLGYDELLAMPSTEQYVTLQCISNLVGGDLVGTAKWTGVPLARVLERAGGAGQGAVRVVFHAVGGYSDSLPLAKALDPATVVAYGMNDRSLPRAHGFPARIIAPGIYGMKNVKWLERIEVVDYDYRGYWQRSDGWDNIAEIKTASRIDVPQELTAVSGRRRGRRPGLGGGRAASGGSRCRSTAGRPGSRPPSGASWPGPPGASGASPCPRAPRGAAPSRSAPSTAAATSRPPGRPHPIPRAPAATTRSTWYPALAGMPAAAASVAPSGGHGTVRAAEV